MGSLDETRETMMETLDFAIDLDIDLMQLNISTPYPGTALYKELVEKGMLRHKDWNTYGQEEIVYNQLHLTDKDIYDFITYAYRKFYLRPKPIFRLLKRVTSFRLVRDYLNTARLLLFSRFKVEGRENWECWKDLKEEDFLDRKIPKSKHVRLTHQLRQERFVA